MMSSYLEVVQYLEALQIMPKTMPGLEKIKRALEQTNWYKKIDPNRVVVVAGTNGKGSTCAALECLLLDAKQNVGFYSSPHLVTTTERIRINSQDISEADFVKLFHQCFDLIQKFELSHFEALTLMAGQCFFSNEWSFLNLDFVILEVGLGGTYDATNAIPHKFCGITKLGLDHVNILGNDLKEVAKNKFGIVSKKNIVVHHPLPIELVEQKNNFVKTTNSNWIESAPFDLKVKSISGVSHYFLHYNNRNFEINLIGERAAENIMTAIGLFEVLGFDSGDHCKSLNKINWLGRMQRIFTQNLKCPMYLSGDHNEQGVESLISLLKDFKWRELHLIVGIGVDKDSVKMLEKLSELPNMKLYLTETPFKGLKLDLYPERFLKSSIEKNSDVLELINCISKTAQAEDMVLVTGSLYLVGKVLGSRTAL